MTEHACDTGSGSIVLRSVTNSRGPVIEVGVAPGWKVLVGLSGGLRPVGYRWSPDLCAESTAVEWTGRSLSSLRRSVTSSATLDLDEPPPGKRSTVTRMALLLGFARARYFRPGSDGLVAAEHLVLLAELAERDPAAAEYARSVAPAAASAVLRFLELGPSDGSSLEARAARSALRFLPELHPARPSIERLLADVGDETTSSIWLELEAISVIQAERDSARVPLFRAPPSQPASFIWSVLWPEGTRPPGTSAETASLVATPAGDGSTVDVEVSPGPPETSSPYPCIRAVDEAACAVLAVAPLLPARSGARGHLYLDEPFDSDRVRIEVVSLPDSPVETSAVYQEKLLSYLILAHLRAGSTGDAELAAEALYRIGQLEDGIDVPLLPPAESLPPFLADSYGPG